MAVGRRAHGGERDRLHGPEHHAAAVQRGTEAQCDQLRSGEREHPGGQAVVGSLSS